jgi:hypothetical protein
MTILRTIILIAFVFMSAGFTDCYKPVTKSGLPTDIRTVAVPAFQFEGGHFAIASKRGLPMP